MLRRIVLMTAVFLLVFNLGWAPRADSAKRRVIILDFQSGSEDPALTWLTTMIPEALRWRLSAVRSIYLIDRRTIERIVGEQGLRDKDLAGPFVTESVGRLAGAHLAMAGRLSRLGRDVQLTYRFVDLSSGFDVQQTRFRTAIATPEAFFSALNRLGDSVIEALGKRIIMKDGSPTGIESSPLSLSERERARLYEPVAKSIEALTRFGNGLAKRIQQRLPEALEEFKRATDLDPDLAKAWRWLGITQTETGRLKDAAESLARALSLLRRRGDEGEVAAALRDLARLRGRRGASRPGPAPLEEALRLYRESLGIDRRLGNEARAARTLSDIARILAIRDRDGEAMDRYEASLAISRRIGTEAASAETLGRMAVLHAKGERFDEAVGLFRKALAILRRLEDRSNETKALNRLADVWVRSRRYRKALETYRQALEISRDRPDDAAAADTLSNLSGAYFRMDRFSKALEVAREAYAVRSRMRDWAGMAAILNNLAAINVKLGRTKEAMENWCDGRVLARRQGLKAQERLFGRIIRRFIRRYPSLSCGF